MITRNALDPRRLALYLGWYLLFLIAYDTIITVIYVLGWHRVGINDLPLPLLGSAIAIIVTFRNNAAYGRWWEARQLWGQVVNNSRSLARAVLMLTPDPALQGRLIRYQIAYVLALRAALLGLKLPENAAAYLPSDTRDGLTRRANVSTAIQAAIGTEATAAGLDSIRLSALHATLSDLANAQGGLERIKKTPLPRQYNQFPQVFVGLYCLLLPIGLVNDLGLLTPIGSTIVGFMFLSLDRIGRDLEDPFENTIHDIPMQAITRTIEIDLLQMAGAEEVPSPVTPVDGVLW